MSSPQQHLLTDPYPTGISRATIQDNRRCRDYVNRKRMEGTLTTITDSTRPGVSISVWRPDTRSISELWTEARATFTNASTTTGLTYDNPEILFSKTVA